MFKKLTSFLKSLSFPSLILILLVLWLPILFIQFFLQIQNAKPIDLSEYSNSFKEIFDGAEFDIFEGTDSTLLEENLTEIFSEENNLNLPSIEQ